jgi:hypothetical protein
MKKVLLFTVGLTASALAYGQTSSGNTPQLQLSGTLQDPKVDTVPCNKNKAFVTALEKSASDSASDKPKSANTTPALSTAAPKRD